MNGNIKRQMLGIKADYLMTHIKGWLEDNDIRFEDLKYSELDFKGMLMVALDEIE